VDSDLLDPWKPSAVVFQLVATFPGLEKRALRDIDGLIVMDT